VCKIIWGYLPKCDGCNQPTMLIKNTSHRHYNITEKVGLLHGNAWIVRYNFCRLTCFMNHPDAMATPDGVKLARQQSRKRELVLQRRLREERRSRGRGPLPL